MPVQGLMFIRNYCTQMSGFIWNKWSKLFDKTASARGRFNRIRQVSPMCTPSKTCFLGPTRVHIPNVISIGSAIFTQLTARSAYTWQWATTFPLKTAPSHGDLDPIWYMVPWVYRSAQPRWHLNRFSLFYRAHYRDTPTGRPCYSICNNRLHVCM